MKEPKIRFKGFSGEWETRHVGELCDVLTGFPFEGSKILPKGKELLMRGINITEGFIRHSEDIDRYYDEDSSMLSKYRLQENDLVIGMDGSKVGKNSALVTKKEVNSLLVQRVARLRNNNPHLIHLIQISLGSEKFFEYVDSMKTSSAIPHISPSDIKNFVVSISVNDDETKFVSYYFQHLDALIQSTTKKIESLKQVKVASLQSMFPQEGETTPRVRFKGFEGEWEKVELGDVLNYEQPSKYLVTNTEYEKSGIPVLTAGKTFVLGYTSDTFGLYTDLPVIIFDDFTTESKFVDFLFKVKSSAMKMLNTVHDMDVDIKFVYEAMKNIQYRVENHQRHWLAVFSKITIKIPSIAEQRAIASYFTSLDRQITLQTQRLEKLKQIKAACLDNMFV